MLKENTDTFLMLTRFFGFVLFFFLNIEELIYFHVLWKHCPDNCLIHLVNVKINYVLYLFSLSQKYNIVCTKIPNFRKIVCNSSSLNHPVFFSPLEATITIAFLYASHKSFIYMQECVCCEHFFIFL